MPTLNAKTLVPLALAAGLAAAGSLAGGSLAVAKPAPARAGTPAIARHVIRTVPIPAGVILRSATYTPSGKLLVRYQKDKAEGRQQVNLATMDDDGRNFRPFFSAAVPARPKDNGLRFMVFPDNKRIFMGDFVLECAASLDACRNPALVPVDYPAQVADGDHIAHRWSEMIIAPDNRHIAWTTLFANFSGMAFTGTLSRTRDAAGGRYRVTAPQIISTLDPFVKDPRHPDGVIPQPTRGGEVKQFVAGGTAISMVGAARRDTPDSVVQHLASGRVEGITDDPGYTETTIFSPDERLGVTMSTRFSPESNLAIIGLMPRPYPGALNMGLSMFAYTHAVTGVRAGRAGNVGPALIDIQASRTQAGYQGFNLSTSPAWVFGSPISWHPSSRKAMWMEGRRGEDAARRIQVVELPAYRPGAPVAARATPDRIPYAVTDLSVVVPYARNNADRDAKVYGRASGYLTYRRSAGGTVEKTYVNFSDDGRQVYSGSERVQSDPRGRSTYIADVRLTGPRPGRMALTLTFGPLGGPRPAALIFAPSADGKPATRGYAEYAGKRIEAADMVP